jgi:hypothetical protein
MPHMMLEGGTRDNNSHGAWKVGRRKAPRPASCSCGRCIFEPLAVGLMELKDSDFFPLQGT